MNLPSRRWAVAATVGTLAALGAIEPSVSAPLTKSDAFVTAETSGILTIEGGECFADPAYSRRAAEVVVRYVPCEDGADNQAYGFLQAPDGPWDRPGLAGYAWRGCGDFFDRRWPDRDGGTLAYYPILPTAQTWADGDRTVMCAVYRPGGRLGDSVLPQLR
ncbi:hypothetical protein Q3W71_13835 [Micromonospora sp. C28SCA-DRY-2]|uniref:hypothetical protein n=1 Tax=Micromonospora sp. C28SCA-DRY-2 TaxID=3059522 RepID=UPI00267711EE|nr:hypothetical protein [Micromonospora sp. C28SCA-DRY-2]MDO3702749.1 hypothetical protein [Micromonospora sp. C28SCA-DRY-2]